MPPKSDPPARRKPAASRPTKRHATIRDVARAVGASVSTISATLNGTDYVSAGMRARINKAIERLQFRPNDLARSLRLQRTHTLAIVVPDISNSFYAEIIHGIKDYGAAFNYTLLIGDSRERWAEESNYLDLFQRRRVDGVIRVPATDDAGGLAHRLLGDIPVIYADRFPQANDEQIGCVGVDNVKAANDAVRYLISLGHERIAIIAGPQTARSSADRIEGYRRALAAQHLPLRRDRIRSGVLDPVAATREAIELLARPDRPTALFCGSNITTLGALDAVQQLGLRCPEEISLLGFDDFSWSTLLRPRLTMVRQPAREIGMTAARVLIDHIEERTRQVVGEHLLPTQLMIRNSCAPPPHSAPAGGRRGRRASGSPR